MKRIVIYRGCNRWNAYVKGRWVWRFEPFAAQAAIKYLLAAGWQVVWGDEP